jgi:amino acid adenylation domain-containing protein
MLVRDFIEKSAERTPEKVALICHRRRHTYGELDSEANRLARALRFCGVGRGDRVVIQASNSVEAVVSIFAVLKAGGVFVLVNPTVKPDKLGYILNDCRAKVLISDSTGSEWQLPGPTAFIALKNNVEQAGETPLLRNRDIQLGMPALRPPNLNAENDLACLVYTSGSTGRPKGVMSEHRQVVFASGSIIQYLENRESDVILNVLPLSFDYGLYQLLMTFRFGGTLVLENAFVFPSLVLERIAAERVTGFPGVPTIFMLLMQLDFSEYDLSSLRYVTNTAAALPPRCALELQRKFSPAKVFSMYGLTETKRTLYLPPEELKQRPGSVGIPIPGTEAWIEGDDGCPLSPGRIGELVISGPHVMRGYWGDPEATNVRFPTRRDGERVCRSGDLFRQDAEGFFYFVGRKDDIIKCRGEKVAPKEIENVLYEMPGIIEAAVIGVPDPICGQAIQAFVVTAGSRLTERSVMAHCRAHLEDFMLPATIHFCDSLPKNASGKIDRLALAMEAKAGKEQSKNSPVPVVPAAAASAAMKG